MRQGVKHTIKYNGSYYLTITVFGWIDLFTRIELRDIIIDSLKYCIKQKGLNVYAYVIMSNHLHLIVNCNEPFQLKDTIRDFKKFTSKAIIAEIENGSESRKEWLLSMFLNAGAASKENKTNKVWQSGNHALELYSEYFVWQKVNYIHNNPVKAKIVLKPEEYLYSSAQNYLDYEEVILKEVYCLPPQLKTYS